MVQIIVMNLITTATTFLSLTIASPTVSARKKTTINSKTIDFTGWNITYCNGHSTANDILTVVTCRGDCTTWVWNPGQGTCGGKLDVPDTNCIITSALGIFSACSYGGSSQNDCHDINQLPSPEPDSLGNMVYPAPDTHFIYLNIIAGPGLPTPQGCWQDWNFQAEADLDELAQMPCMSTTIKTADSICRQRSTGA